MANYFYIKEVTENEILHGEGKYYYEIEGAVLGSKRFQASQDELKARMVPAIILPNKQSFYVGDCAKHLITSIMKQGGTVYRPLIPKSEVVSE
jgi:hypothetical protein